MRRSKPSPRVGSIRESAPSAWACPSSPASPSDCSTIAERAVARARFPGMTADLPDTARVEAPAKINLFLRVLGRRPDGYHELETLIVPIELADRLEVHAHS